MLPFVYTPQNITVTVDGNPRVFAAGSAQYNGLEREIFDKTYDFAPYLTAESTLQRWLNQLAFGEAAQVSFNDLFVVEDRTISYKTFTASSIAVNRDTCVFVAGGAPCGSGYLAPVHHNELMPGHHTYEAPPMASIGVERLALPPSLQARIWRMADEGADPRPLFKFYERLNLNPSMRSREQLFTFLQHEAIPLDEDGFFLAYKGVQENFLDKYTGTFENKPGMRHKMARNLISDDPRTDCSYGFHVGSLAYAKDFAGSGQKVICRVDPRDVVCVPFDCNAQKVRVCEYEVIGNWDGESPLPGTVVGADVVSEASGEMEVEGNEDEDEDEGLDVSPPVVSNYGDNDVGGDDDASEPESRSESWQQYAKDQLKPDAEEIFQKQEADRLAKFQAGRFRRMGRADVKQLMGSSIEDLRAYAGQKLKIIGASKIPGGKAKLVARILKVRKAGK